MTENALEDLFDQVERYVVPLITNRSENKLSKEENKILAFQKLNRLNQRIGMIARSNKNDMSDMKTLQTFVNSITIGVKHDNIPQIKYGLVQTRSMISFLSKKM